VVFERNGLALPSTFFRRDDKPIFGLGARYAPEKALLAHQFKLKMLAIFCVGSSEVMLFLTRVFPSRGLTTLVQHHTA